jgi:glycosyltransferase involved in cell wall biosynthesis
MKVLHVIPSVAPRYGGPSLAIFPMCKALQESGCEVRICTTNADGPQALPVELERTSEYDGIETIFFSSSAGEFKYSHRLAQWLDANVTDFDLVHIHAVFNHPPVAAARACRKRSVPYIVRPLGTLDPWSMSQRPLKKSIFWRAFGKSLLENAAAVHYTTETEQQTVEDSLKVNHGVVIPLGVEEVERGQRKVEGSPYVLVLSRLHPKKNIDRLIAVFASLVGDKRFMNWKLVLAGDGEEEYVESLKSLVEKHRAGESIIFRGWLEGMQKSEALNGAALLALPSHQENFGVCLVEAMACGVPVLVSPQVNLAAEIEKAGAGWIAPITNEDLRTALEQALSSAEERRTRGKAARTLSQQYSWPVVSNRLLELYRTLVL